MLPVCVTRQALVRVTMRYLMVGVSLNGFVYTMIMLHVIRNIVVFFSFFFAYLYLVELYNISTSIGSHRTCITRHVAFSAAHGVSRVPRVYLRVMPLICIARRTRHTPAASVTVYVQSKFKYSVS